MISSKGTDLKLTSHVLSGDIWVWFSFLVIGIFLSQAWVLKCCLSGGKNPTGIKMGSL